MHTSSQVHVLTVSHQYTDKRALVVEDLDTMRTATVRMLLDLGFKEVFSVKNGLEALALLSENEVDLIVSDWMMPKLNGLELLKKVRSNPEIKDMPFVMSTVVVDQGLVLQAIKAGVSEYLAKPFSFAMLRERVDKAFTQPLHKRMGMNKAKTRHKDEPVPAEGDAEADQVLAEPLDILIVDDVPDNIQVISEIIKPLAKIKAVTSGKGAMQICRGANPPDLILLDVMMPEMDGYQVIEQLKNNQATRDIPVIFLTAKNEVEDITRGFDLGAVDYVTKPVQPAVLTARVTNQMRIIEYQNSLRAQMDTLMDNIRLREDLDRIIRHDLNNPLTAIIGAAEQMGLKSATPKLIKQNSDIILQSAMMINQMVSNLSTLSRIEDSGFSIEKHPVSLLDTIRHVVSSFPKEMKNKSFQVEVTVSAGTIVLGEKAMLYSMFANLFKNALDAAPRGTRVHFFEQIKGNRVEVTVQNVGAVPKEIRDDFFEKYVTKGKPNGTGLGTYSAKLIAEAHGGSIALDAGENDTRVKVTLLRAGLSG